MQVRGMAVILTAILMSWGWQAKSAQKLKDIGPTKYESSAPASDYRFEFARSLKDFAGPAYPQDIEIVSYRSNDGTDYLHGVLDKRAKRPKWILQPHYELVAPFGSRSLVVKKVHDADHNFCVLNLEDGSCPETDFNGFADLAYRSYQKLPGWVGYRALYVKTSRKNVIDLQLFTSDDRPLTIVRDVMNGLMAGIPGARDFAPKVFQVGDRLGVRTINEEGEIRDVLLALEADGRVSSSYVSPHAILEFEGHEYPLKNGRPDYSREVNRFDHFEVMQTANAELGLVWPFYARDGANMPMPEGLLGLLPLSFDYDAGRWFAPHYGDQDVAVHVCCTRPLGWVAVWVRANGAAYALLPRKTVPDYASVVASRSSAHYTDVELLWQPGPDNSANRRSARAQGQLIGQYALHKAGGIVEIYSGDNYGLQTGKTMKLDASMASASFPAWRRNEIQKVASKQAAAEANFKAMQEREQADRVARERALAEQAMRLKLRREALAAARSAGQAADAASLPAKPRSRTVKVYGSWVYASQAYCTMNLFQTDLYAKADAKKACKDKGGTPGLTLISESGYDPYRPNAEQCYQAKAVTECMFYD